MRDHQTSFTAEPMCPHCGEEFDAGLTSDPLQELATSLCISAAELRGALESGLDKVVVAYENRIDIVCCPHCDEHCRAIQDVEIYYTTRRE
jgi:hypothetical protein